MGRKPNNADVFFKPKPVVDENELNEISDIVDALEDTDVENMEVIYSKLKSFKSFFGSVEISNSKELKPSREAMAALESKYKRLNGLEQEIIDVNIVYLRVQKKISKADSLAKDSTCFADEAELNYLKAVKGKIEAMIALQDELIVDLGKFEKLMNDFRSMQAKRK